MVDSGAIVCLPTLFGRLASLFKKTVDRE